MTSELKPQKLNMIMYINIHCIRLYCTPCILVTRSHRCLAVCIWNPLNTWLVCFSLPGLINWLKCSFLNYSTLSVSRHKGGSSWIFEGISIIIHASKYWLASHRPRWLWVKILLIIQSLMPLKSLALSLNSGGLDSEEFEDLVIAPSISSPAPLLDLYGEPVGPSHDQHTYKGQGKGSKRWTCAGRGAGAAQVEQTSVEVHLRGVMPQILPDGADFLFTVGQRCEGTCVESFPMAAHGCHSPLTGHVLLIVVHALSQHQDTIRKVLIHVLTLHICISWLQQGQEYQG